MNAAATVLLSNALCAVVLAIPAILASRVGRRPALAHALWLLVLLKLVTPPLIDLPVLTSAPEPEPVKQRERSALVPALDPATDDDFVEVEEVPAVAGEILRPRVVIEETRGEVVAEEEPAPPPVPEPWWPTALVAASLLGSAGWLLLMFTRWRRFQRTLAFATPAPKALIEQVFAIAARLEVRRYPSVWLVPGRVSPMLWGLIGTPRLLIPAELWRSLSREQQETLLLHELAHLKRNDHRVRLLELLVTALYWWHPVVWLARRELRECEEQCCDAWVVWARPEAARSYATALLECVDFLSEVQTPLPLGASGIGRVDDLKRRLTMIMGRSTPRRLTVAGLVMVLGLAAMLLPTMPTWAQSAPQPQPRKEPGKEPTKEDVQKLQAEVEKLRAALEDQLDQAKDTEKKLREAVKKLDQMEQAQGSKRNVRVIIIREGEGGPQGGQPPMGGGGGPMGPRPGGMGGEGGKGPLPGQGGPGVPGPMGPGGRGPNTGQGGPGGPGSGGTPGMGGQGPRGPQGDKRVEDLERKLEDLMRQLEEVRKQLRNQQNPPRGGGSGGSSNSPYSPVPVGPGGGVFNWPSTPGSQTGSTPGGKKNDVELEIELRKSKAPTGPGR